MRSTPRDDIGRKSARSPSAADLSPELYAGEPTDESVRDRLVIGIFDQPPGAYAVLGKLQPDSCDVLVMQDGAPGETRTGTVTDGRLTIHYLESPGALAAKLATALAKFAPFAALTLNGRIPHGGEGITPGLLQRLFQNLVHHLAAGAAVVIIHAPDPERQRQVSRALLEAKCDVLLTHDVLQATGSPPDTLTDDRYANGALEARPTAGPSS